MFNARRQKISFIKRFYLLGLFVVFVVFAVLASGIYSKKSRIEQDLKSQSEIAVNLMKHHNDDLLSELDDIQNSIALTSKPLEVMNSKMDKKGEFNAIFYLKNDLILASDYNKIAFPSEFDIDKFKDSVKKSGFYISDFIFYAGIYRYFIIKQAQNGAYLVGFVDTKSLVSNFAFPNSQIRILNSNGHFISGANGDIYDIYGDSFSFKKTDRLVLIKEKLGGFDFLYIKNIANTQNFVLVKRTLFSELNGEVIMFLVILALFGLVGLFLLANIFFLNSKVIAPINEVKKILMSSNKNAEVSTKIIQKGIFKDFSDDILKFSDKFSAKDSELGDLSKNFYDIFKQSSLCVLIADGISGMIVDYSETAKQIYGNDIAEKNVFEISANSLLERQINEFKANYANENYMIGMQNTINGQKSMYVQRSYIYSNGAVFVIYIMFDMSKYINLQEQTNRQYEFMQNSPQIMMVYDFNTSKVLNLTSNAKAIWGYDYFKFINGEIDFFSIIHLKDVLRVRNEIKNNISLFDTTRRDSFEQTYRIRHLDNEYYTYSVFAKILHTKGKELIIFYFNNIDTLTKSEEKSRYDSEFYKNIIDTRTFVTWEMDLKSKTIEFDGNFLKILNYEDKYHQYNISFGDFKNMILDDDVQIFNNALNDYINGQCEKFIAEYRIKGRLNQIIWLSVQGRATNQRDGLITKISGIFENITERKEAEIQLKLNASVFSNSHEGIMLCGKDGLVMRTNKAFSDITGYNEEEVLGRYPSFLFAKNKEESVQALRNSLTKDDVYRDEIEGLSKKGEIIPAIVTINAIRDDKGEITNYMIMFMEIYGIKEREEKLQLIAHYDALTNLPNRIYFMQIAPEFMQKAKDSGKFMAVLFIDYDGFKAINDTYGHDVGDIYLREISAVMKKALRENDFLARLGGDEFCAIIPNIDDKSSLTPILNRLLEASNTKFNIKNEKIGASASIGVAFYNGDEEVEFKDLLSRADKAMYNAKTLHKGGFSIYEDMGANSQVDRLVASIRNNEFFMLYQPMIDAKNNEIFGYELLLRWNHPNMGILLPGDFLLDLNESDLERVLSIFSLSKLAEFQSEFDCICSINISSTQLQNNEFYEHFAKTMAQNPNVNHSKFIFEITDFDEESVDKFKNIFEKYAEFGVKFAINSVNSQNIVLAKNLPFYMIKVQRDICLNAKKSYDNIKMLKAILLYAEKLDLKVGAQGIEDDFSLRLLKNLGFDYLQGNVISKALKKDEITGFANKFKKTNQSKPISKTEFNDFLIFLDYKKTAEEFINLVQTKKINKENFNSSKAKFSEILEQIQTAKSDNFNLNTEIHKQILDILTLDYENLQNFVREFTPKLTALIKNTEDL